MEKSTIGHMTITEPESVFEQIKNNGDSGVFCFGACKKVSLDIGWLSLAHNLLKQSTMDQKLKIAGQG